MKKIIFIPALLFVLSLCSCKKDYTCTCTTVSNGTSTTDKIKIIDVRKSAAKANCVSTSETSGGQTNVTTCSLS